MTGGRWRSGREDGPQRHEDTKATTEAPRHRGNTEESGKSWKHRGALRCTETEGAEPREWRRAAKRRPSSAQGETSGLCREWNPGYPCSRKTRARYGRVILVVLKHGVHGGPRRGWRHPAQRGAAKASSLTHWKKRQRNHIFMPPAGQNRHTYFFGRRPLQPEGASCSGGFSAGSTVAGGSLPIAFSGSRKPVLPITHQ